MNDDLRIFELLSVATEFSYENKYKEAWEKVHEADRLVGKSDNHVYDRLRDAVCTLITENKMKGGTKA